MIDITRPSGQFDPALLMDEIFAALPALLPQHQNDVRLRVEAGATGCKVGVPDDTSAADLRTLDTTINAHDYANKAIADQAQEVKTAKIELRRLLAERDKVEADGDFDAADLVEIDAEISLSRARLVGVR